MIIQGLCKAAQFYVCYYLLFLYFVQLVNNHNNNRLFTSGFGLKVFQIVFFGRVCTGNGKVPEGTGLYIRLPDIRYNHAIKFNNTTMNKQPVPEAECACLY